MTTLRASPISRCHLAKYLVAVLLPFLSRTSRAHPDDHNHLHQIRHGRVEFRFCLENDAWKTGLVGDRSYNPLGQGAAAGRLAADGDGIPLLMEYGCELHLREALRTVTPGFSLPRLLAVEGGDTLVRCDCRRRSADLQPVKATEFPAALTRLLQFVRDYENQAAARLPARAREDAWREHRRTATHGIRWLPPADSRRWLDACLASAAGH